MYTGTAAIKPVAKPNTQLGLTPICEAIDVAMFEISFIMVVYYHTLLLIANLQ